MTTDDEAAVVDQQQINEWRALANGASPGPWTWIEKHGRDYTDEGWSFIPVLDARKDTVCDLASNDADTLQADAAFIAAAREAVPVLLGEVERLILFRYNTRERTHVRRSFAARTELENLRGRIDQLLDDPEAIEDFELDLDDGSDDRRVLDQCHCAHCEEGDGICPMAVQQLVGDHLRALRDRIAAGVPEPAAVIAGGTPPKENR